MNTSVKEINDILDNKSHSEPINPFRGRSLLRSSHGKESNKSTVCPAESEYSCFDSSQTLSDFKDLKKREGMPKLSSQHITPPLPRSPEFNRQNHHSKRMKPETETEVPRESVFRNHQSKQMRPETEVPRESVFRNHQSKQLRPETEVPRESVFREIGWSNNAIEAERAMKNCIPKGSVTRNSDRSQKWRFLSHPRARRKKLKSNY